MFYVYEHWDPIENKCFYVGKGHGPRAMNFHKDNKQYKIIIEKLKLLGLKPEIRFIYKNLKENEAIEKEKERILHYGIDNLCNYQLNNSGKRKFVGMKGKKHVPETKKKMSMSHFNKKHTLETKKKISESRKKKRIFEMDRIVI